VSSPRPDRIVFVTGTGTEVGKTWWGAATLSHLRALGVRIAARKPTQSGTDTGPTDADVLAAATGERPDEICPPHRSYPIAWAPPMAAEELGRPPFTVADLVAELEWPPGTEVGLVEGVGGPRSPIATDGDTVDLARLLEPDVVVIVADPGLGAINAVRLTAAAFDGAPFVGRSVVVALNRFGSSQLHARNLRFLVEHARLDVVTEPGRLADRLRP